MGQQKSKTVRMLPHPEYARFVIARDYFRWNTPEISEAEAALCKAGIANLHRGWVMFADPVAATVVLRFHGFNVIHGEGVEFVE